MKQRRNKLLKLAIGIILAVSLTGCAHHETHHHAPAKPKQPTRAQIRHHQRHWLEQQDVQFIKLGQDIRIVIPGDNVFHPHSANPSPFYRQTFAHVARFINTYDVEMLRVAVYADNSRSVHWQQVLTQTQAQTIASSLWRYGVKAGIVYADGEGRHNAVAWNTTVLGRSKNRRIEISFRFYPRVKQYN